MNLNLLSLNSRGFSSRKESLIFDHLRSSSVDICCLQETMISDPDFHR